MGPVGDFLDLREVFFLSNFFSGWLCLLGIMMDDWHPPIFFGGVENCLPFLKH